MRPFPKATHAYTDAMPPHHFHPPTIELNCMYACMCMHVYAFRQEVHICCKTILSMEPTPSGPDNSARHRHLPRSIKATRAAHVEMLQPTHEKTQQKNNRPLTAGVRRGRPDVFDPNTYGVRSTNVAFITILHACNHRLSSINPRGFDVTRRSAKNARRSKAEGAWPRHSCKDQVGPEAK